MVVLLVDKFINLKESLIPNWTFLGLMNDLFILSENFIIIKELNIRLNIKDLLFIKDILTTDLKTLNSII